MWQDTIEKKYHFYSAHRNENLNDKCNNIHGHTYKVYVMLAFNQSDMNNTTGTFTNFGTIDKIIEPLIYELDHATLASRFDKELNDCIVDYPGVFGKVVWIDGTTSVENLIIHIHKKLNVTEIGRFIKQISVEETTTSKVTRNF